MSDPIERPGADAYRRGGDYHGGSGAQEELARLRGEVERLMRERMTPALAGADLAASHAQRKSGDVENRFEKAPAVDDFPAVFEKAVDEMMGGFDARLAEVHRRLDGVPARRR